MRTFDLAIDRLSYGPAGVGRLDGKAVFVPGTVPGDIVEVALDAEKKTYATGHIVALRHPSPQRRHPPCPYVPTCGGCPWQQISYAEQLRAKENLVREQMRRIGGIDDPPLLPIIASPQEWHYRHRIRLHVEGGNRLGFTQARSHQIVEIASCLIAPEDIALYLQAARAWLSSVQTPLREIELLTDESTQGIVLLGIAEGGFHPADDTRCTGFLRTHPAVRGLVLSGRQWRRRWGHTQLSFALGVDGLTLAVSPGVFTQVNPAGNRVLIEALLRLGDFRAEQRVIELYCGAGNLSVPVARRVKELIGIEHDRTAVSDSQANATRIGLTNARFLRASARAGLESLLRAGTHSDIILLDPPRAGAAEVVDLIPRLGASIVLCVSCDPATLARDLHRLSTYGYQVRALQPLDLFPHSYHVETIALSVLTC